jgi:hypothetical protein
MTVLSASEARKRLYNLVDEVKVTHVPVQIVGKRSSAVLVSEEDCKARGRPAGPGRRQQPASTSYRLGAAP